MTFPDPSAAFDRMLIMGNGGAGKTWLACRIGEQLQHPVVHLDDMHWEPGRTASITTERCGTTWSRRRPRATPGSWRAFTGSWREAVTDFTDRLSTSIDEAIYERAQISE
nr:hypothetical protein [Rhizobium leguminosarum]